MTAVRDTRAEAMSELATALLDALDEASLDQLAMALAPRLGMLVRESVSAAPWLDARGAAERLALSRATIYELSGSLASASRAARIALASHPQARPNCAGRSIISSSIDRASRKSL
jgi:hypothetical protein